VPEHLRASGVGWYSTTVGLLQLVASVVAGMLWDRIGHAAVSITVRSLPSSAASDCSCSFRGKTTTSITSPWRNDRVGSSRTRALAQALCWFGPDDVLTVTRLDRPPRAPHCDKRSSIVAADFPEDEVSRHRGPATKAAYWIGAKSA
jgi:hypothetical protein